MDTAAVRKLLEDVRSGRTSIEAATETIGTSPYVDLDFAKLDTNRELRNGFPEVVFCQGKHPSHAVEIFAGLAANGSRVLGTRATRELFDLVQLRVPEAVYHELSRCIVVEREPPVPRGGTVLVVAAGTSDLPVAEEAAVTAEVMGNPVERLYDVGVAGLHRLLAHLDTLRAASILIVVAGMEGALPSVVGGLVRRPTIAVPTSVGYGANFGGLSALLGMLNSCASGVTVVNIDNGFGAGCAATRMNQLREG
jgi:NCAIR mutase (PurE)-related protein